MGDYMTKGGKMMKKLMFIVMSVLIVLLAACGNKPAPTVDKNSGASEVKNDIPVEEAGVKAEWQSEEHKDGGKLLVKNSSEKTVGTGMAYKLEKWKDGDWETVNNDQMFTEQMIEIKADGQYEQAIELKDEESGTYRINKTFYADEKKHNLAVVFEKK
jgi:hypothetical protein